MGSYIKKYPGFKFYVNAILSIILFLCVLLVSNFLLSNKFDVWASISRPYEFSIMVNNQLIEDLNNDISLFKNTEEITLYTDPALKEFKKVSLDDGGLYNLNFSYDNSLYEFAGLYFSNSRINARDGNNTPLSLYSESYEFTSSDKNAGIFVFYLYTKDFELDYKFNFESNLVSRDGNDFNSVGEILSEYELITENIELEIESDKVGFTIINNDNFDYEVKLYRRGQLLDVNFNEEILEYNIRYELDLIYGLNNFIDEDVITFVLNISPKKYILTIDWNGGRYFNINTLSYESFTNFNVYYKNPIYLYLDIALVDIGANFKQFAYEGTSDIFTFNSPSSFVVDNTTIIAQYDFLNKIEVIYKIVGDETRDYISRSFEDRTSPLSSFGNLNEDDVKFGIGFLVGNYCTDFEYFVYVNDEIKPLTENYELNQIEVNNKVIIWIQPILDLWTNYASISLEGEGTFNNPFLIKTAADLAYLTVEINNEAGFKNKYFQLNNDIDLKNKLWTPIGTLSLNGVADSITKDKKVSAAEYLLANYLQTVNKSNLNLISKPFKGFFNGNGKTISGMTIIDSHLAISEDDTMLNIFSGGLFGFVDGGRVHNINIKQSYINGFAVAGSVAGVIVNSDISNIDLDNDCKIIIEFASVNQVSFLSLGNIVGLSYNSQIKQAYAHGNIYLKNCENAYIPYVSAGGVGGESSLSNLDQTMFDGKLELRVVKNLDANYFCGGIIGSILGGYVKNSYNRSVEINTSGFNQIGGISGDGGEVSYSYSSPNNIINDNQIFELYENSLIAYNTYSYSAFVPSIYMSFVKTNKGVDLYNCRLSDAKTEVELKSVNTYVGFDSSIWNISGGSYPTLKNIEILYEEAVDSIESTVPAGSGSLNDPYLISNAENLAWMASESNNNLNKFTGKYFKQTADINLLDMIWIPICSEIFQVNQISGSLVATYKLNYGFEGFYDGNNFKIYNLEMHTLYNNLGGVFGKINGGSVSRLNVSGFNISANTSYYSIDFDYNLYPFYYVGSIAAIVDNEGSIQNCKVLKIEDVYTQLKSVGMLSNSYLNTLSAFGSVVGAVQIFQASISSNFNSVLSGVGAIAGCAGRDVIIENCSVESNTLIKGFLSGGIVGHTLYNSIIIDSNSYASVEGAIAGGIVGAGLNNNVFENIWCFDLDISNLIIDQNIGNLIMKVSHCENYKDVQAKLMAGGISGLFGGDIICSKNSGDISCFLGFNTYQNQSLVSIGAISGGIAGRANRIIDCISDEAQIISVGDGKINYYFPVLAGGVSGVVNEISNCYNLATVDAISNSLLKNTIVAISGGIVGVVYESIKLLNSINFGCVLSDGSSGGGVIGSLINDRLFSTKGVITPVSIIVSKCYFNINITNLAVLYNDRLITKTEWSIIAFDDISQFYGNSYFINNTYWNNDSSWDFDTIWIENEEELPTLAGYKYTISIKLQLLGDEQEVEYSGNGEYKLGELVILSVNSLNEAIIEWIFPNGETHVGSQITFTLKYKLVGEVTLRVYFYKAEGFNFNDYYYTIIAHYSSETEDYDIYYGDNFGIRSNLIIGVENDLPIYAGNNNVLQTGLIRGNYVVNGWEDHNSKLVSSNYCFTSDLNIYAVWVSTYISIKIEIQNGFIQDGGQNIYQFNIDDINSGIRLQLNILPYEGYKFYSWWYLTDSDSLNMIGTDLLPDSFVSVKISELLNYIGQSNASSITLLATFIQQEITVKIVTNDLNLGRISVNGIDFYNEITVDNVFFGDKIILYAQTINNAQFLYFENNLNNYKIYAQVSFSPILTNLNEEIVFMAVFVSYGYEVDVSISLGVNVSDAVLGKTRVAQGEDLSFNFSVLPGYYIDKIYINNSEYTSLNNNISLTSINQNYIVQIIAKELIQIETSISKTYDVFSVVRLQIEDRVFYLPLDKLDNFVLNNLKQGQIALISLSLPANFGVKIFVNNEELFSDEFDLNHNQNLSIYVYKTNNKYLTYSSR